MNSLKRGFIVALLHVLIICSLGAKLLIDRATRPRVWVKTFAYDPNLPIRGRYASMRLMVEAPQAKPANEYTEQTKDDIVRRRFTTPERARLEVRNGELVAIPDDNGSIYYSRLTRDNQPDTFAIDEPVAFFLPDTAQDPTFRSKPGEELWAEVTVPRKGPPRPIRLAVKSGNEMHPLDLR